MTFLRRLLKTLIAAFVVWQCTALFLYSLISVEGHPILEKLYNYRKYVRPYILITSQWQRWNLFSPDPLRRVIAMNIDANMNEEWRRVETVGPDDVSFLRRANELKIIRRMEDEKEEPLRQAYIDDVCRRHNIPTGTQMRMTRRWHVIPKNEHTQSAEWWHAWEPDWKSNRLSETTCFAQT